MPTVTSHLRAPVFLAAVAFCVSACGGGGGSGGNNPAPGPGPGSGWLIPAAEVVDGGPGRDGIPSIDAPAFEAIASNTDVGDDDLVIAVLAGSDVKVYPHAIMDWHEIVNDVGDSPDEPFALSYCPLTGTAVAWEGNAMHTDRTFGVSGRLYNSNLILFDRETDSLWVQMMELAVNGPRIEEIANRIRVVETTKRTIRDMHPNAMILTRDTGFTRDYDEYPYGSYRADEGLLFPVSGTDNRLHPKTRVLGVRVGGQVMAYELDGFGVQTLAVQDQVGGRPIIVAGDSDRSFAVAYDRELSDGTILNLSSYSGADPAHILQDDEGNIWNVWGTAVAGPRAGDQLGVITSYVGYWFAFVAFYPQVEIYFNPD